MTSRSTWKRMERDIAKIFGVGRNPLSGGNSKHTRSDTLHPILYIECKYAQKHAATTLFLDTLKKAKVEKKIPIICLKARQMDGVLLGVRPEDLEEVARLYAEAQNQGRGEESGSEEPSERPSKRKARRKPFTGA